MVGHTPWGPTVDGHECILSKGTIKYMVKGCGSERFRRYSALYELEGVGHIPRGFTVGVTEFTYYKKRQFFGFRVRF